MILIPLIEKKLTERSSKRSSDRVRRNKIELDASQVTDVHNYRFVLHFQDLKIVDWLFVNVIFFCTGFLQLLGMLLGNLLLII